MPLKALYAATAKEAKEAAAVGKEFTFDARKVSQILRAVNPPQKALPPEEARITVHSAVSRISVLYEKLRNAVEYREEHLLRKGAIGRILRRQFVLEQDPFVISSNLIRELIGARYLPNETLSETLIDDVAKIIQKYQAIEHAAMGGEKHLRWVLGVISTELEEVLVDPVREKALVTYLYEQLSDRIHVKNVEMEDTERRLHIYTACYRTFIKADDEQVSYKFLRAYLNEWMRPDEWMQNPEAVAERLLSLQFLIEDRIKSPLTHRFIRAVRPWSVSLWMLTEALDQEQEKSAVLGSRLDTHTAVAARVEKRERMAKTKLRRGTVRAMVYLLVTKILFALAIEVPTEWYLYRGVSMIPLAINIALPPTIMLFVGALIRRPGNANRMRILEQVDMLLSSNGVPTQEIRYPRKRVGVGKFLFSVLYLVMFAFTFGAIGYALTLLDFTPIAIAIFFFFLCVVSFFGYRLRQTAREILVVKPKERILYSLLDFFTLPILRAGRWFSQTISSLNVVAFVLDLLFEAPLKLFLGIMEESLHFIREKKDELNEQ